MKKQTLTLIGVLTLLLAAGSALAQNIRVQGDIPFQFAVDKDILPAGHYSIQSVGTPEGMTLALRGDESKTVRLVNTHSVESLAAAQQTKLVFKRYGASYFLSEVWVAGNSAGHQLRQSSREKEMARDNQPREVVVMASLR